MSEEQLKNLKKDLRSEVTKDLSNKDDLNWNPQWSSKLIRKARRNEYIDLTELRQDGRAGKDQQTKDLPGGEFQVVFKNGQGNKKELTSIIEWASLYHNLIALYEAAGNQWALHQSIKNGRFVHNLIGKDKYTWPSVIDYDAGRRRAAKPKDPWNYDAAVACSTLQPYNKDEKAGGRKRGAPLTVTTNVKSKVRKVVGGGGGKAKPSSRICFHWAAGGCNREAGTCNYDHYCKSCNLGPKDKHAPGSCAKGGGARSNKSGRPQQ